MNRTQRIEKLNLAIETLKKEFIGLDKILDELKTSICPWYITPEVVSRPQIISLWGMTGTGKTSVIHRLVELLELESQTLFFDCGEDGDGSKSVSDKINDYLGDDDDDTSSTGNGLVFVFDEFQYARTLNESGEETSKSNFRAIWNIIDSGIINLTTNGWDTSTYLNFLDDLSGFSKFHPGVEVSECNIVKPEDVKAILDDLGLIYFDRGIPGFMRPKRIYGNESISEKEYEESENPYRPLRVIQDSILRILRRKVISKKGPEYFRELLTSFKGATTLEELLDILEQHKSYIMSPKYIDCSDSLIFILGNLDEAFKDSKDTNPDVDADLFLDTTSRISINDIKEALKKRFRPEQIARFGNNIIKYPSLGSSDFKKVISQEVDRICTEFEKNFEISVNVDNDFMDLLYSEGVYPTQGVRPVFTTIGSILTPLLSKILIFLEPKPNKSEYSVRIGLHGDREFKKPSIRVHIDYSDVIHETVTINLQLGSDRNPENRKTRVINSVHEAGHAVVMSFLTGEIPMQVISVSTDHGGFCLTYDKDRDSEIKTRQDIANNVCISLAGYEAESLIFGSRPEMLLCGSSSDITTAWDDFAQEAYKGGYFEPFCYSNIDNESSSDGIPLGYKDVWLTDKIKSEFDRLRKLTQEILAGNRALIIKMAERMSDSGGMIQGEIQKMIEDNKLGTLTIDHLKKVREKNSYEWYLTCLR